MARFFHHVESLRMMMFDGFLAFFFGFVFFLDSDDLHVIVTAMFEV